MAGREAVRVFDSILPEEAGKGAVGRYGSLLFYMLFAPPITVPNSNVLI